MRKTTKAFRPSTQAPRKAGKLCEVTGPKGGRAPVRPAEGGLLEIGSRVVMPHDLADYVRSPGERRRVRRALYGAGFRGLAAATVVR